MRSQSFDGELLAYMRRKSDRFKFGSAGSYPSDKAQWEAYLSLLHQKVNATKQIPDNFSRFTIKRKSGLTANELATVILLRKVNDNIRKAYGIKQPSRGEITHEVAQLLHENTTKHVIKVDIKSFFESVPISQIYKQLEQDRKLSTLTLHLVSDFLRLCKKHQFHGVPRGLSLSATLAELHVRDLDRQIRNIPGVYHVNRYVDDITIFCFKDAEETSKKIREILRSFGLRLNSSKCKTYSVHMECSLKCPAPKLCPHNACEVKVSNKTQTLELLGYAYEFKRENGSKKNVVSIRLSRKKIARMKTRIVRSFDNFRLTGDAAMLLRRIKYLAGNHMLKSSQNRGRLRAGIFYSYMHCDLKDPGFVSQLRDLDGFLRARIANSTRAALNPLSLSNAARLGRVSFHAAVAHRITSKSGPHGIDSVKECWKYG